MLVFPSSFPIPYLTKNGEMNAPIPPETLFANIIRPVMSNLFLGGYHTAEYLAGQYKINAFPIATITFPIITHTKLFNTSVLMHTPSRTIKQSIEMASLRG